MKQGDEVIYTILIPQLTNRELFEQARKALEDVSVPNNLIVEQDKTISVPRLFTLWQGDEAERIWQEQIKAAAPSALIAVQPWSLMPGYPKGDVDL